MSSTSKHAISSKPVYANYASEKIVQGAGVAIFHLASEMVVVCYHTRDRYWFLPKGRRNVGELIEEAACREGFEEVYCWLHKQVYAPTGSVNGIKVYLSGYRNRLLPLPILHRQPDDDEENPQPFVIEPLWHQFMPQSSTAQYTLSWFAAETLPREIEAQLNAQTNTNPGTQDPDPDAIVQKRYAPAPAFPDALKMNERVKMDIDTAYSPPRHLGTGVDDEEACYEARLLPIAEARKKLRGSIMEDVVRRGWEAILLRQKMESKD